MFFKKAGLNKKLMDVGLNKEIIDAMIKDDCIFEGLLKEAITGYKFEDILDIKEDDKVELPSAMSRAV